MALVNPNIAMSFRAPEIQQQNMLADYAAMQQIQSGRQAQEMNALKMQEAQAAMQERNALRQLNPAAADYESQLFKVSPQLGIQYRKERSAADASAAQIAASQAAAAKSGFDLKAAQRKFGDDLKRGLSANPSDANIIAFGEDAVLQGLYTPEQVKATVDQLLALPAADRVRILSQAGASPSELKPSNLQVNQGGQTQVLQMPAFGGAGTSVGTYAAMPLPADVEAQKRRISQAGAAQTKVILPEQEKAFEGELGKGQAKSIIDNRAVAQDAASIIETVNTGRDILKGKIITGAGADFLVNFNQALKTAGIDFGYADAAANSQAYAANMAQNVGRIIKQFGAGTGLSDADRQYAEKMAGGKITLDAKALNKILDINERAARNVITRHNKDVAGIKTNIPLTVEMPAKRAEAPITAVNPSTGARIQSTDGGKTWTAVGGS
jgi:hypothetical protein